MVLRRSFEIHSRCLQLRFQSNLSSRISTPKFIVGPDGRRVPYPYGTNKRMDIFPICAVGADAVIFSPDNEFRSEFVNQAKMMYLAKRDILASIFPGKWFAISSNGNSVMSDTEDKVRTWANNLFPDMSVEDYYANCLGSEVSFLAQMDSTGQSANRNLQIEKRSVLMIGEFSVDGKVYSPYSMKWDPGCEVIGVPAAVLSSYSLAHLRDGEIPVSLPDGSRVACQKYKGLFFKIAGLTTRCDVYQLKGDRWLIGYDIISRYQSVLDYSQGQWLHMVPLAGQQDDK